MRNTLCLLLAFSLAASVQAADQPAAVRIAVFDFKADWHTDYRLEITHSGQVFSALMAQDLSVLKPLVVVGRDANGDNLAGEQTVGEERITPAAAKALGDSLHAAALVTGQLFRSTTQLIIAAKVVLTATGQTSGTLVQGNPSTSLADLTARLSAQIANLILYQPGSAPLQWKPASIVGSGGPDSPGEDGGVTYVAAIDGKPVVEREKRWKEPLALLPGTHEIIIGEAGSKTGFAYPLAFRAYPGARYQVHYNPGGGEPPAVAQAIPIYHPSKIWIQDLIAGTPVPVLVVGERESSRSIEPIGLGYNGSLGGGSLSGSSGGPFFPGSTGNASTGAPSSGGRSK